MARLYNAQVAEGQVVVGDEVSIPIAGHCCEVPDEHLEEVQRNRDFEVYTGQVPWPDTAAEAEDKKGKRR